MISWNYKNIRPFPIYFKNITYCIYKFSRFVKFLFLAFTSNVPTN